MGRNPFQDNRRGFLLRLLVIGAAGAAPATPATSARAPTSVEAMADLKRRVAALRQRLEAPMSPSTAPSDDPVPLYSAQEVQFGCNSAAVDELGQRVLAQWWNWWNNWPNWGNWGNWWRNW